MCEKKEWFKVEVEGLIEMYHNKPELWDVSCKAYKNRVQKFNALRDIAEVFCVPVEEIQRKIHNLRNQFNNEFKKTSRSKSGQGTEECYISKWPYYNSLMFLQGGSACKPGIGNLPKDSDPKNSNEEVLSDSESASVASSVHDTQASTDNSQPPSGFTVPTKRKREKKGHEKNEDSHDEVLKIIGETIKKQAQNPNVLDRFDHLGSNIAAKLRDLKDNRQRAIAEKLISEVLFHAEFGNLTPISTIQCQQLNP